MNLETRGVFIKLAEKWLRLDRIDMVEVHELKPRINPRTGDPLPDYKVQVVHSGQWNVWLEYDNLEQAEEEARAIMSKVSGYLLRGDT